MALSPEGRPSDESLHQHHQKFDPYYGWVSMEAAGKLENIRALEARRDAAQRNVERLRRDVQGLTDVLDGKAPLRSSSYMPDLIPPGAGRDYIFSREYLVKALRKLQTELDSSTDDVETLSEDLRKAWANLSDS
jgi:hypothetical protein